MQHSHYRRLAVLICFLLLNTVPIEAKPKNAILLSEVASLTFRKDARTSHRRVPAVPQLKCVGGSAHGLHEPEVVRCRNAGASYSKEDVEWTCVATLPEEFKLGSTDVICEGYSSSEDPYVLKGSCGLEYRLILTQKGEQVYGNRQPPRQHNEHHGNPGLPGAVFWFLFFGVFAFIIWSAWRSWNNPAVVRINRPRRGGYRIGRSGGGGYDDGHDDPPPPYSQSGDGSHYKGPGTSSYTSAGPSGSSGSWQPGFGTGAAVGGAAGAAAGYYAGRRAGAEDVRRQDGGGSWFGGGGSQYTRAPEMTQSTRTSSSSSSRRTYSSTGFGGTSRR